MVTRQALDRFNDLPEVAGENGVARHFGFPGRIERPCRARQMRRAADAACARRDDEPGLRVLVAKNDFETAEQLGIGPSIDDDAVLNFDADVEIAFDASDRRNIKGLYCC